MLPCQTAYKFHLLNRCESLVSRTYRESHFSIQENKVRPRESALKEDSFHPSRKLPKSSRDVTHFVSPINARVGESLPYNPQVWQKFSDIFGSLKNYFSVNLYVG